MHPQAVVNQLLKNQPQAPQQKTARAFAPSNIALSKYWGKRDQDLFLPMNSSVSISLGHYGCQTQISLIDQVHHQVLLEGVSLKYQSAFYQQVARFLDFFSTKNGYHFCIKTRSQLPVATGLASSAAGFAALTQALAKLFAWRLPKSQLSILARLGSGSAARSLWSGFVVWYKGQCSNGMDSFATPIHVKWPEFCVGLLLIDSRQKYISSREAMQRTLNTSPLYAIWPNKAEVDCACIIQAIKNQHFVKLGELAEQNALLMHASMQNANPPIHYWQPDSIAAMKTIWQLRSQGLEIYFTMDAGANLKLLFLKKDQDTLSKVFPSLVIIEPFASPLTHCQKED